MQKIFLIAVLLALSANVSIAQDKVIKWANDSLILDEYDTIIRKTGNQLEGKLEVKRFNRKKIYEIKKGSLQSRYTYSLQGIKTGEVYFKNGQPHGKYTEWNDYGSGLTVEGYYNNGLQDSNWVFYHHNGKKQFEGRFLADSSNLIDYFEYERSVPFEGGGIAIERVSDRGHSPFDGDWVVYDEEGNRVQTLRFKRGVLVGFYLIHY